MARAFVCCNCGKIFEEPNTIEEYRGEFWGFPSYETVSCSPCCHDEYDEVEVDDDGNIITDEEEE